MIKDTSTPEQRIERSKTKEKNFRKMLNDIAYKNEGEIFLKSLNYACMRKMQNYKFYQVN